MPDRNTWLSELVPEARDELTPEEFCRELLLQMRLSGGMSTGAQARAIAGLLAYQRGEAATLDEAFGLSSGPQRKTLAAQRRCALLLDLRRRLSPRSPHAAARHLAAMIAGVLEAPPAAQTIVDELRETPGARGWRQILRILQDGDCHAP